MGVFTNMLVREEYGYAEDVLKNVKIHQFDESSSLVECGITALAEAEQDWNNIVTGMAMQEYAVLEATGEEMVYEAVNIKGFFQKVIDWFKKLWSKISGLIQKLLTWIQSKISSDKAFLNKYGNKLKTASIPSKGIEYKGFTYEYLDMINYQKVVFAIEGILKKEVGDPGCITSMEGYEKAIKDLAATKKVTKIKKGEKTVTDTKIEDIAKKTIKNFGNNKEKIFDKLRGSAINRDSAVKAADFTKEAKKYMQGKPFEKFTNSIKNFGVKDIYAEIENGKYTKENCKIAYNELKNKINTCIARINNVQKNVIENSDSEYAALAMRLGSIAAEVYRQSASIYATVNQIQTTLLAARHNQAKALAQKLLTAKESAYDDDYGSYVEESETGLDELEAMFEI